jgi:predicted DNA-binding transcriptional regulator YafY
VALVTRSRRVRIERIAEEMEISRRSAHRWVASASRVMPIRLESGTIIYEEEGDTIRAF